VSVREADVLTAPYPPGYGCVLCADQLVVWFPDQNLRLTRAPHGVVSAIR